MLKPQLPHVKWVLPNASAKPVTFARGINTYSWFDIIDIGPSSREDEESITAAGKLLDSMIDKEILEGTPAEVHRCTSRTQRWFHLHPFPH